MLNKIIKKVHDYYGDTGSKPETVTISNQAFNALSHEIASQNMAELSGVSINQSANVMGSDVVVQGEYKNPWYKL